MKLRATVIEIKILNFSNNIIAITSQCYNRASISKMWPLSKNVSNHLYKSHNLHYNLNFSKTEKKKIFWNNLCRQKTFCLFWCCSLMSNWRVISWSILVSLKFELCYLVFCEVYLWGNTGGDADPNLYCVF